MTKQDVEASNNVMASTLSLFYKEAKALFNFGATRFFISCVFTCHFEKSLKPLKYALLIATLLSDCVWGIKFLVDLLTLEMYHFDFILGMN